MSDAQARRDRIKAKGKSRLQTIMTGDPVETKTTTQAELVLSNPIPSTPPTPVHTENTNNEPISPIDSEKEPILPIDSGNEAGEPKESPENHDKPKPCEFIDIFTPENEQELKKWLAEREGGLEPVPHNRGIVGTPKVEVGKQWVDAQIHTEKERIIRKRGEQRVRRLNNAFFVISMLWSLCFALSTNLEWSIPVISPFISIPVLYVTCLYIVQLSTNGLAKSESVTAPKLIHVTSLLYCIYEMLSIDIVTIVITNKALA